MANEVDVGGRGTLFVGEDKILRWEVLDVSSVPVNIASWDLSFRVKTSDLSNVDLIAQSATVTGTYSATRASNTQRALVTLTDTQMNTVRAKQYRYALKRMDDGSETVIAYGNFTPEQSTVP